MTGEACTAWVSSQTGLTFERGSGRALRKYIDRRRSELGIHSDDAYLALLQRTESELQSLVDEVTVTHTWFFRDIEQLSAVRQCMAGHPGQRLHIWVAGCASGEEAYTAAMIARSLGRSAQVLGTDVNSTAIARAVQARYSPLALRTLPPEFAKHFESLDKRRLQVVDAVRRDVRFAVRNILQAPPVPEEASSWDFVFCRNVLIYFSREHADAAIAAFARSLRPGGYLVLGASDALVDVPRGFVAEVVAGRVIYRRIEGQPRAAPVVPGTIDRSGFGGPYHAARPPGASSTPVERVASVGVAGAGFAAQASRRRTAVQQPAPEPSRDVSPAGAAGNAVAPGGAITSETGRAFEESMLRGHQAMHAGDLGTAYWEYSRATEEGPVRSDARLHLGVVCYFLGDLESALHSLRGCLLLEERCWCASYYLAAAYEGLGLPSEARREYRHAAQLSETAPAADWLDPASPLREVVDDLLWLIRKRSPATGPRAADSPLGPK